jgi:hypothetical protein
MLQNADLNATMAADGRTISAGVETVRFRWFNHCRRRHNIESFEFSPVAGFQPGIVSIGE